MSDGTVEEGPTIARRQGITDNWLLIGAFTALTIVAVALATGVVETGLVATPTELPDGVAVPLFVYLYATLGAMGYVFTKLMADIRSYDDRDEFADLVEMGMRVPAAWVLATGFYLLALQSGVANPVDTPYAIASVAFLVGLYVNVAIKSLGSLADRMLGRGTAR